MLLYDIEKTKMILIRRTVNENNQYRIKNLKKKICQYLSHYLYKFTRPISKYKKILLK